MPYPYGLQGAPAVGGGLPGLPQRGSGSVAGADPSGPPAMRIFIRPGEGQQQFYNTPEWASYARVTALGKGGRGRGGTAGLPVTGTTSHGGGGAGLAGTNIELAPAGVPIVVSFDADATRVSFLGYQLTAGNGGDATDSAAGAGGLGSGGAVNFNGGSGALNSGGNNGGGGGAAGRGGNGAPAIPGAWTMGTTSGDSGLGDAYTTGGGVGAPGFNTSNSAPAGSQGRIRMDACVSGAVALGQSTFPATVTTADGGDGGGGSSGSTRLTISNMPGAALVLIELW